MNRWQILGLHLRSGKGRHRLYHPCPRRTHRQHILRASLHLLHHPLTKTRPQTDPCGLQLFHLLSHTNGSGGATLLVDGFYVASIMKELHPEAYMLLSSVPVPAHAAGEASCLYSPSPAAGYPVLGHDPVTGELAQVRWNNDDRSVMRHLAPDLVEKWCVVRLPRCLCGVPLSRLRC